jgi:hypothetical protein
MRQSPRKPRSMPDARCPIREGALRAAGGQTGTAVLPQQPDEQSPVAAENLLARLAAVQLHCDKFPREQTVSPENG